MDRRTFLLGLAALPLGCGSSDGVGRAVTRAADAAVDAGARFLVAQQAPSGAFPSATYGLLKSGQSLTPHVLTTLLALPARHRPAGAWATKGLRWLGHAAGERPLGLAGAAPDYPCYASGMALSALAMAGRPEALIPFGDRTAAWLRSQQYLAPAWAGHPAEGGFGMGYEPPRTPPDAGHVDLSMTRRVLQGLRAWAPTDAVFAAARPFVDRCGTADGGFVYSPVEFGLNKAGCEGGCTSYGSATADGILALLACRAPADDPRLRAAADRLRALHRLDENPGIPEGRLRGFARAMVGYYRAAAAQAFAAVGGPAGWRAALIHAVVAEQRPDGSWANPEPLQKEDDPLIATSLAVQALTAARWGQPS